MIEIICRRHGLVGDLPAISYPVVITFKDVPNCDGPTLNPRARLRYKVVVPRLPFSVGEEGLISSEQENRKVPAARDSAPLVDK